MLTTRVLLQATQTAVTFDAIYTAEDIGSYKPSDHNFDYMLAKLETLGVQKNEVLHGRKHVSRPWACQQIWPCVLLDLPPP